MALDNTKRGRTTQIKIFTSIVERLIDQIEELTEDSCWVSDQAIPLSLPGGRVAVTVSLGRGQFPQQFYAGGGTSTLTEDGQVIVCPIIVNHSDRPRRKWKKIVGSDIGNESTSILEFKLLILKALLGDINWEPSDGVKPCLRDELSPINCDEPMDVKVGETLATAMKMRFATTFDWDLS